MDSIFIEIIDSNLLPAHELLDMLPRIVLKSRRPSAAITVVILQVVKTNVSPTVVLLVRVRARY